MQGLILEGTTEDSVRLSDAVDLVGDLAPRQVRVEIRAAGVCGSDLSCVHGKYYMPTPLIPGHEAAGVVVAIGSSVTYCEVGDHVILSTFDNCGHCDDCEGGNPGTCAVSMGGLRQPYAEGDQPLYNFANIGAFTQKPSSARTSRPDTERHAVARRGTDWLRCHDRRWSGVQPSQGADGRHRCRDRRGRCGPQCDPGGEARRGQPDHRHRSPARQGGLGARIRGH